MSIQPDSFSISEPKFDTLEVLQIDDHLTLIQVSEDGESETLVIGPEQQKALMAILRGMEVSA